MEDAWGIVRIPKVSEFAWQEVGFDRSTYTVLLNPDVHDGSVVWGCFVSTVRDGNLHLGVA